MNAPVTALHAGRTRALVQRKNRKAHVASLGPAEPEWLTICGRWVPVEGTAAELRPTPETIEAHADVFCSHCFWIFALVQHEVGRAIAAFAAPTRTASTGLIAKVH